jgi:transcriptional regulator with XRE-family HTH domain
VSRPTLTSDELLFADELRSWRERRGLSKKALAEAMAYDPSRVSHIEGRRQPPTEEFSRQAEAVLQTGGSLWARWEAIAAGRFGLVVRPPERDLRTAEFVAWLADHSDAGFLSLYSAVNTAVARLDAEPPSTRYAREHARGLVTRAQLASAVAKYYGKPSDSVFYRARVGGDDVLLSVLTRPEWLEPVDLRTGTDLFTFVPLEAAWSPHVDEWGVSVALDRLAAAEVKGTVMVNNPLYRLLDIEYGAGRLAATVTTIEFAEHALTTELVEGEMLGAIGTASTSLPLRDTYLPSIESVFALHERACVGGAVSLFAAARRRPNGRSDYVMFVQERSGTVLNLAGKLAVVPKGFHQPTGEPADEAQLSVTLRREMEEELLGRQDLEQVGASSRRPAPRPAPHRADGLAARQARCSPNRVHWPRLQPCHRQLRVRLPHRRRGRGVVGAFRTPGRVQLGGGACPPLLDARHRGPDCPRGRSTLGKRKPVQPAARTPTLGRFGRCISHCAADHRAGHGVRSGLGQCLRSSGTPTSRPTTAKPSGRLHP